jgi:hypothetical protein
MRWWGYRKRYTIAFILALTASQAILALLIWLASTFYGSEKIENANRQAIWRDDGSN